MTEDERKEVERTTMIRCVNMIDAWAKEQYEKTLAQLAPIEREDYEAIKVEAFDRQSGATPLLQELGMTFSECRTEVTGV